MVKVEILVEVKLSVFTKKLFIKFWRDVIFASFDNHIEKQIISKRDIL